MIPSCPPEVGVTIRMATKSCWPLPSSAEGGSRKLFPPSWGVLGVFQPRRVHRDPSRMVKRELLGEKRGLGGGKKELGGMGHERTARALMLLGPQGISSKNFHTLVRTHKIKDGFPCVLIHASRPSVTVCEVAGLQHLHCAVLRAVTV